MKWYQGSAPNIGVPVFLVYHRHVRYFLQIRDLQDFPYGPISRKVNIAELEKELRARIIFTFEHKHGVRSSFESISLQEEVKCHESLSSEENMTRLKKALEVNAEAQSGQLDVDMIKFFKPVLTDLDQSIFKVDW
jgi:hypothetical protein